ncbi:hypothetical protein L208DRAFT_1385334 [Tricholoma matsutake]|nr:hypothetical protein L208DRAFT_1385273 [Tricholoma matsutake 945]KAF8240017.1 hypothetical protein L208DRAFT_1385334 [Tricholoma matsutake 945]
MNEVSQNPIPSLAILSLKMYYTAIFTLLLYDYCLTFSAEVMRQQYLHAYQP